MTQTRTTRSEQQCIGRTTTFNRTARDPLGVILMNKAIVGLVEFCTRNRWIVIIAGRCFCWEPPSMPPHARQVQLIQAFSQRGLSAVVASPAAEKTEIAINELARALAKDPNQLSGVTQPDSVAFLNALGCCLALHRRFGDP